MKLHTKKGNLTEYCDGDLIKIDVAHAHQRNSVPVNVEILRYSGSIAGIRESLSKRKQPLVDVEQLNFGDESNAQLSMLLRSDSFSDSRKMAEFLLLGSKLDIAKIAVEEKDHVRIYMIEDGNL